MNTVIIRHTCPHCNSFLLADQIPGKHNLQDYVFDIVSQLTNIPEEMIFNCTRKQEVVFARQIIMMVLHKQLHRKCNEVAILFNKDHATVLSAIKRLKDHCDTEPETKATIEYIMGKVEEKIRSLSKVEQFTNVENDC